MTNRRGGLSCTASPSIPAGTDLRALTSRSGAARGWPREGRTVARHVENDNPELAGVERGAVPRGGGRSSAYGLLGTSTTAS